MMVSVIQVPALTNLSQWLLMLAKNSKTTKMVVAHAYGLVAKFNNASKATKRVCAALNHTYRKILKINAATHLFLILTTLAIFMETF